MTLYNLTGQYLELLEMAQDETMDQKMIKDTMEGVEGEYESKAEGYAMVLANLAANDEALKKEMDKMAEKRKLIKNNMERIRRNLKESMIATGKRKFSTALFSFRVQNAAPSLNILDEKKIPKDFWKPQDPILDKKALLAEVKKDPEKYTGCATIKTSEALVIK